MARRLVRTVWTASLLPNLHVGTAPRANSHMLPIHDGDRGEHLEKNKSQVGGGETVNVSHLLRVFANGRRT